MAKDYAKRNYNLKPPKKNLWRVHVALAIVVILACAGYWTYTNRIYSVFAESQNVSVFFTKIIAMFPPKKSEPVREVQKKINTVHSEPKVHFDFYTELPNMQVRAPMVDETKRTAMPSLATVSPTQTLPKGYIIQLGVFKDATSASELRFSLLLSGCEADVVKVKTKEGERYQVQRGPFVNVTEAKRLQLQLQKKGIEGVVKGPL